MEEQIKELIEDLEADNNEFEDLNYEHNGGIIFNKDLLIERLEKIISKPRYEIIGHIVKECEICGTVETLLVISDNKLDKILARCEKCKPMELKK